jgi:hypothetical protein
MQVKLFNWFQTPYFEKAPLPSHCSEYYCNTDEETIEKLSKDIQNMGNESILLSYDYTIFKACNKTYLVMESTAVSSPWFVNIYVKSQKRNIFLSLSLVSHCPRSEFASGDRD